MQSRSINLLVILAVFLSLLGGAGVVTSARAKTNDLIPVTDAMLHEDGSLNLPPGFSGSLDLDGWDVQLDTTRGPVFRPPQAAISGAWSALGTSPLYGFVSTIAISGTDVYAGGILHRRRRGCECGLHRQMERLCLVSVGNIAFE